MTNRSLETELFQIRLQIASQVQCHLIWNLTYDLASRSINHLNYRSIQIPVYGKLQLPLGRTRIFIERSNCDLYLFVRVQIRTICHFLLLF